MIWRAEPDTYVVRDPVTDLVCWVMRRMRIVIAEDGDWQRYRLGPDHFYTPGASLGVGSWPDLALTYRADVEGD